MATYSTTAIVNKALVLCGATTITAITDDTPNARSLNTVYEIARKDFLCENRWSFSSTRSTLATVATTTFAFLYDGESYAYSKPSGILRIWGLSDPRAVWHEEGDYIFADSSGLGLLWSFDQSDVSKWQPAAVEAFIDKLASDIAYMIINSVSKAEAFLKKYKEISLPKATAQNSQTGFSDAVIEDTWLNAKYGTTGGDPSRSYS